MTSREDGNSLGWARVTALAFTHFFQHITMSTLAPVLTLIQKEFFLSYSQLGLLVSLPNLSGGLLQLPAGILSDRVGKVRILLTGFALLLSAVFVSGLAPTFAVLLVLQLIRGVGESVFHPTTYALISQGAARHRLGRSMSIHTLGGFAGSAVGLILVAMLAERVGWRTAFMMVALPGVAFLVLLRLWFKEPPAAETSGVAPVATGSVFSGPLPLIFFAAGMGGLSQTGLSSFLPTFLGTMYGMTVSTAAAYSSLMVTAGLCAMLVGGWLADRVNRLNMVIIGGVAKALAVSVLAMWAPPQALLGLVMVGLGISIYLTHPAYSALLTNYSGGSSRGRLYGLSFSGSALGGSIGALLVGFLADLWGFRMAFMAIAMAAIIRAALLGALKAHDVSHPQQAEAM